MAKQRLPVLGRRRVRVKGAIRRSTLFCRIATVLSFRMHAKDNDTCMVGKGTLTALTETKRSLGPMLPPTLTVPKRLSV